VVENLTDNADTTPNRNEPNDLENFDNATYQINQDPAPEEYKSNPSSNDGIVMEQEEELLIDQLTS